MEPTSPSQFQCFGLLIEDLQLSILSFIAEAPFENSSILVATARTAEEIAETCHSTLTHVLPLVSRQFYHYCQQDLFWKMALIRLLQKDYDLWTTGLRHVLSVPFDSATSVHHNERANLETTIKGEEAKSNPKSPFVLGPFLEQIHGRWGQQGGYIALFQDVVQRYLRCTAPIFYMPGHIMLHETFRLHLFEQRYRIMIADLLMAHPESARDGSPIPEGRRPTFLYVFDSRPPPSAGKTACLVHLSRCFVYSNGTADVECLPVDYVLLENVWVRREQGNLFMGQSRRMNQSWKDSLMSHDRLPPRLGLWVERLLGQQVALLPHEIPNR
jgi:hypothetical protein